VELVNFDRSVWLDHSRSRSLVAARSQPPVFPGLLNVHARSPHRRSGAARLLRLGQALNHSEPISPDNGRCTLGRCVGYRFGHVPELQSSSNRSDKSADSLLTPPARSVARASATGNSRCNRPAPTPSWNSAIRRAPTNAQSVSPRCRSPSHRNTSSPVGDALQACVPG
jgi:hypothetical protein